VTEDFRFPGERLADELVYIGQTRCRAERIPGRGRAAEYQYIDHLTDYAWSHYTDLLDGTVQPGRGKEID
jgi:hypothetical protein